MKQKELLDNIKKYLSRFQAQVHISSSNNEYDINVHSENVIIPILNAVYGLKLANVNFSGEKNAKAIDLIDAERKVAFQVTSTRNIEKIKSTVSKLQTSRYRDTVEVLYVYILTEKQANYSQQSINKVASQRLKFSAKSNILDATDLYRKIVELNDIELIEDIEQRLKKQFQDVYINTTLTLDEFDKFKVDYTNSCLSNFSRINFFGLSVNSNKPREIELYRLFVQPIFKVDISSIENRFYMDLKVSPKRLERIMPEKFHVDLSSFPSRIIKLEDKRSLTLFEELHTSFHSSTVKQFRSLFDGSKNIVVIGKPGAGKSSFIKYSICKLLEKDSDIFSNSSVYQYLPIRIELHKYNKYKKSFRTGFIDYVASLLKEEYQITLSSANLESIVQTFPTLFFFDGLDEIFDVQDRLSTRNDIETFIQNSPKVRALVTSRYESYEEVNLSPLLFAKYEILDFNKEQVKEYVTKWYEIEESSVTIRQREVKNCLNQLQAIEDELKYNPLLLSLILLLYRNELDIPTSKLKIYESCTNTIVETRDEREKKLDIKLKVGNVISVFASLAFWQFEKEIKGDTLNFETVKSYVRAYLLQKGEFGEEHTAGTAASEFMDFAKTRSIYFENKFTHKTFLEYFTAYYIFSFYYSNYKRADELKELLSRYLGVSSWSVVLELLFCKIDSTQITYDVIDELIEQQLDLHPLDAVLFFLQILKYLRNVSPAKVQVLLERSFEFCLWDSQVTKEGKVDYKEILFTNLASLSLNDRYKETIEAAFRNVIHSQKSEVTNVVAFGYEFAIVTGNTQFVKFIQEQKMDDRSPYTFILKYYPNLFDREKYIEALKLFIKTFSGSQTAVVYKSPFNQKIFFGSDAFNWNINFVSVGLNSKKFYESYRELISLGLTKDILLQSAKQKSCNITFPWPQEFLTGGVKDLSFKKFVKTLRSTYRDVQTSFEISLDRGTILKGH